MTLRVAFIDDRDIVRSGFVQLLSLEADIQVVGEFSSAAQARRPAGAGGGNLHLRHFDARRQRVGSAGGHSSGIRVVMLSMHDNPALVEMALDRGASGFLSKRCKPEDLITAVRTVAGGGVYLMPEIAQQLARVRVDPLTRREREIALLLAQGVRCARSPPPWGCRRRRCMCIAPICSPSWVSTITSSWPDGC